MHGDSETVLGQGYITKTSVPNTGAPPGFGQCSHLLSYILMSKRIPEVYTSDRTGMLALTMALVNNIHVHPLCTKILRLVLSLGNQTLQWLYWVSLDTFISLNDPPGSLRIHKHTGSMVKNWWGSLTSLCTLRHEDRCLRHAAILTKGAARNTVSQWFPEEMKLKEGK